MVSHTSLKFTIVFGVLGLVVPAPAQPAKPELPPIIKSAQNGPWSATATWVGGKVPGAGARVLIKENHRVVYDVKSDAVLRAVTVSGTLSFATDKDTRMDVGLLKVQPGEDCSEEGFDCEAHIGVPDPNRPRPTLEIGTANNPIPAKHTALIRLTYIEGMDKQSCPAIVCCTGKLDIHGAAMNRTWVKLGATANKGDKSVTLAEAVTGWKVGDRIIVTATSY